LISIGFKIHFERLLATFAAVVRVVGVMKIAPQQIKGAAELELISKVM
jgi:hypothetical protein